MTARAGRARKKERATSAAECGGYKPGPFFFSFLALDYQGSNGWQRWGQGPVAKMTSSIRPLPGLQFAIRRNRGKRKMPCPGCRKAPSKNERGSNAPRSRIHGPPASAALGPERSTLISRALFQASRRLHPHAVSPARDRRCGMSLLHCTVIYQLRCIDGGQAHAKVAWPCMLREIKKTAGRTTQKRLSALSAGFPLRRVPPLGRRPQCPPPGRDQWPPRPRLHLPELQACSRCSFLDACRASCLGTFPVDIGNT
jgi:hypothetical protein